MINSDHVRDSQEYRPGAHNLRRIHAGQGGTALCSVTAGAFLFGAFVNYQGTRRINELL
ncbi:hypothetical protein CCHOA_06515 [Corynebacterium choanae]|uniref:Uncharacterized protein n=1 Tax=Corynebacterium choanae TaxID=1862358 RepID=A0A3G6J7B0_9CORY|nr:hypothetical protein CCHOA_06515 [Corynebacterium choanae]